MQMSSRVENTTIQVTVDAHVMLGAGTAYLRLNVREGPAPGIWRWNLADGTSHQAARGRVSGVADYADALRYAANVCAHGYEPGSVERGLLEQFATRRLGR